MTFAFAGSRTPLLIAVRTLPISVSLSLFAHPAAANTGAIADGPQPLAQAVGTQYAPVRNSALPDARSAGDVGEPAPGGSVSMGRAADLVGAPLNLARPKTSPLPGKASASRGSATPRLGPFAMPAGMPVAARALTSGFGWRQHPVLGGLRAHAGVDLAAPAGSPIVATSAGVVSREGWYGGYGLLVALDHGGGVETRYGHMSRLNVVSGQRVRKGDVIGYVGSTGRSTGPHLHYEMRIDGQAVNPMSTLGSR